MTDPDLHDPDLLEEIELLGELVIAASASTEALSAESVDAVLGLADGVPAAPATTAATATEGSRR